MRLSTRTVDEISEMALATLGLVGQGVSMNSPEAIAASVRRIASLLCPSTPRALIDATVETVAPVLSALPTREELMTIVEQLISSGDLLELRDVEDRPGRLLYLAPPSFVMMSPGRYLVTGIRPLAEPLVGPDLSVHHVGHLRTVTLDPADAEKVLRAHGLHRVTAPQWIGQPAIVPAAEFLETFSDRLSSARPAGVVAGLTIIDSAAAVWHYRRRWRLPTEADTGDAVGRRPQAYGADHWCVVRLRDGAPVTLVDLPVEATSTPGHDSAWRVQAAIDAVRGNPQMYRVRALPGDPGQDHIVDLFSPLPSWADRYLDLVGMPVDRSVDALFSYRLPITALAGLDAVLTDTLWMTRSD
ncbi:hypothetical protein [uncultured Microbacterium sp.]|uniref:hypothetical protein n=1 Tax=uncultured Microbacterium sp. TaxID=191216 RepID=UPI0028E4ED8F|nr:hypothetical protein [uncultured Microbacterium sp.]